MTREATTERPVPEHLARRFAKVQNGSDIRGVAVEGIQGEPVSLTSTMVYFIGRSFADWLSRRLALPAEGLRVAVGSDPRVSGGAIVAAFAAGAASRGASVVDAGLSTTPAMFMSTILPDLKFDGAVMATASHLPYNRNGLKFFVAEGGLDKGDIKAILDGAARDAAASLQPHGLSEDLDLQTAMLTGAMQTSSALVSKQEGVVLEAYARHLQRLIQDGVKHPTNPTKPLSGMKVVVDAGNGSGGFFASMLADLGADTTGSQFLEPNGTFPNHVPNPEDPTAMQSAAGAVARAKADLGIVFDTDVDRSAVVAPDGREINRNRLIAVLSAIVLEDHPGSTVVTDSVTSKGLAQFIQDRGGRHLRYRRGYKNVISKGMEINAEGVDCQLMIETSGHGAMKENYFLDDGAYLAVKILIKLVRMRLEKPGSGLPELLKGFQDPLEGQEVRFKINDLDRYKEIGARVLDRFKQWASQQEGWELEAENFEGWRYNVGESGWVLLRQSLHDPILVLNAESDEPGQVAKLVALVKDFVRGAGETAVEVK